MWTCSRARKTTVPKTRRIGWAKLPAVYCRKGLALGVPQSQAGPRRNAFDAKRWITEMAAQADAAMKRNTRSPLYELRLSAIGMIVSHGRKRCAGIRA